MATPKRSSKKARGQQQLVAASQLNRAVALLGILRKENETLVQTLARLSDEHAKLASAVTVLSSGRKRRQ